jgi:hypothetical protein
MALPSEIAEDVRQRYNAVGDNFFSDTELYDLMFDASWELLLECEAAPTSESQNTVSGTQTYALTSVFNVERVTWNACRLDRVDFIEDDLFTGNDFDTTQTGEPRYYTLRGDTLYLRPVPNAAQALIVYGQSVPSAITAASTLTVPVRYQMFLKNYLLMGMFLKDGNASLGSYYRSLWEKNIATVKRAEMKRRFGELYSTSKDIDVLPLHDSERF